MKILKTSLVLICFALFMFACSQNTTTTNTTTNKTITQNQNGTTVSYDAANSTNVNAPPTDEMASVKKIFSEKCVLCHKDNGEGGEVNIEGEKFKVPSFKNEKVAAGDDKKYTRIIEEGDDKMPAFKKKLSPEEIAGLIKYIRKDFQGK